MGRKTGTSPAAAYAYMGMSRRIGLTLGNGIAQTFTGGSGYTGLDTFGRIKDLHFKQGKTGTQVVAGKSGDAASCFAAG